MSGHLSRARQYLLAGVSYAIPFVAAGGILIAAAIAFVPMTANGPDFSNAPLLKTLLDVGTAGVRTPRAGSRGVHRVRHGRPPRPRSRLRRRGDRGPGGRGVPRGDRRGAPRGVRRPGGQEATGAGVPQARHADPRRPGRRVGRRRLPHVPRRRRADPAAHGVSVGLAPGDEHGLERRPRRRPGGDDRVRHGRPREQGRVLLRRRDDQGRERRGHGRVRRGDLRPAARAGAGDASRHDGSGATRSATPGGRAWPWG